MNWPKVRMAEVVAMRTGKLDSNAAVEGGEFPFFTCSQQTLRIDKPAFDTKAVLLGGNNAAGVYPLKYYEGEFNAYQRTYIIETSDPNVLNIRFLFYSLKPALSHFQNVSIGAATQYLTKGILDNFKISLPPLHQQDRIASILSAYDDLIENNRRRIQLLEQSARLLYKEWFVHLRFPGHEHVKIKACPGPRSGDGVTEGWEKKKVKELLAKVKRPGKIQKADYLADGPIPCIDQSQEFIGGYTDQQEATIDELPMIVFGDHTRVLKFIDFPFACGADGTQLLVTNDSKMSQEFFFFSLDTIDLSNYFYARHFKFLKDQHILKPTDMLVEQFTGVARPVMKQVKVLRQLNCELAKARDLLLPKLMNGEVAV